MMMIEPEVEELLPDLELSYERNIAAIETDPKGPVVVYFGGIHGNEPSGVAALENVMRELKEGDVEVHGNIYAYTGNIGALRTGKRFIDTDLNRVWTEDIVNKYRKGEITDKDLGAEAGEFKSILEIIDGLRAKYDRKMTFLDLHTTSAPSKPFIPINDTIRNRLLARRIPVPTVLGIEEFLEGPILSYINEIGHIALGFEGGQHRFIKVVKIHEAFIWLTLHYTKIISLPVVDLVKYRSFLNKASGYMKGIYEVRYRYAIFPGESFIMLPGYYSFQYLERGEHVASTNGNPVFAPERGYIFMPLYQDIGEDGFYTIREVSAFWLQASLLLRLLRFDLILAFLPGIKRSKEHRNTLIINRKITKGLSKNVLHLLGFRIKKTVGAKFHVTRREV